MYSPQSYPVFLISLFTYCVFLLYRHTVRFKLCTKFGDYYRKLKPKYLIEISFNWKKTHENLLYSLKVLFLIPTLFSMNLIMFKNYKNLHLQIRRAYIKRLMTVNETKEVVM